MESTDPGFDPTPQHARLARLEGAWQGTARTWMDDPSSAPVEATWSGRMQTMLGGRFVQFEYRSSLNDKPLAGQLIFGWDRGEALWTATWFDTFHTGTAVMLSTGPEAEGAGPIRVLGSYFVGAEHPRWGWRTELDDADLGDRALVLRMYNIMPDGQEALGVEVSLRG
jgi:hypothetical protein